MKLIYRTGEVTNQGWTDEEEQMLAALLSLLSEWPHLRMIVLGGAVRSVLDATSPLPDWAQ